MKKIYQAKTKYKRYICILLVVAIAFLTVGFASRTTGASITNVGASVRIQRDIRITDVSVNNAYGNAISHWEEDNIKTVAVGVSLPQSNSSISYDVKIINVGNIEAVISQIDGLPSNLKYSFENYHLRDMLCDDEDSTVCKLGSETTVTLKIEYADNGFDSTTTDYTLALDFTFGYVVDSVAKVGDSYFDTVQEAINSAPTDKTETTVILLKNTQETTSIDKTRNIVLNLNNQTLSNDQNKPVMANYGILRLTNGKITTDAETNGAVNNETTGTIVIDSVRIEVTGGRQAFWNNKGKATIQGSSYFYSEGTERAACQNVAGGTMTILGGTFISVNHAALQNAGTLTIGVKDGEVSTIVPMFQGKTYGINSSSNYSLYDGIVKAQDSVFNDISKITDKETNCGIVNGTEVIGSITYKTAYLAVSKTVTFNPNETDVTLSETTRYIVAGQKIGTLPTPTKSGKIFQGWYTEGTGGTKIDANTIIENDVTFFAHWSDTTDVAQIGNNVYATLDAAIKAAPSQATIILLKDASEAITVAGNKNITINLNEHTLRNNGNKPIFENSGTMTLLNGYIKCAANQASINNKAGSLTINNVNIVQTGLKQALYITGGTVEITGNSYLISDTYGTPDGSTMERGTVQVISGTLIVNGGTIVGSKQQAISNEGIVRLGTKDGVINSSSPVLIGKVHGVRSSGTLYFYDGLVKGEDDAINGVIEEQEDNSQLVLGTETDNNVTYITAQLAPN